MKPESSNFNYAEIAKKYEETVWIDQYVRHGIPPEYHQKWFFNYDCKENEQLQQKINDLKNAGRNGKPIALLGDVGKGKTHLACSILKDAIIHHESIGKPFYFEKLNGDMERRYTKVYPAGHYHTMTTLNRDFREAIKNDDKSEEAFMEQMTNIKCLVIDEIQIRSKSESENRMFQELIDRRCTHDKQTVFLGNVKDKEFKKILGERLEDRLRDKGLFLMMFTGDSYRGRNGD